ncbi:MAG: hypothetical protein H6686_00905 [Fibrobacteria bacterium]|nr:hypothetical protein [Fibrobacteria bacterium]
MKIPSLLVAGLASASLVSAFSNPRAEFSDYTMPDVAADTVYTSMSMTMSYANQPDFNPIMIPMFVKMGYVHDSVAKTFSMRASFKQWFALDAKNRLSSVWTSGTEGPMGMGHARTDMSYDAQGRIVSGIQHDLDTASKVDSTLYTWTHTACADIREVDPDGYATRTTWTVDAQGRCDVGTNESRLDLESDWMTNSFDHLLWSSQGPVQRTQLDDNDDTLEVQRIKYNADGVAIADSTWEPTDAGELALSDACATTLNGKNLVKRVCSGSSENVSHSSIMSTSPVTGIQGRAIRNLLPLDSRVVAGEARFHNPGSTAIELQVLSISGAIYSVRQLQPGATWSTPLRQGVLIWRATSANAENNGILNAVR